ncbi:protein phosphatase 1 regulatory subunit 1C isoform 2-T2 [Anomaloglossus baeobatrachus]|uniref:protein phosphatase 1 regulatory subunit 1C isoform X2 n=1 Tax=Anomaloglossus baeobatrachus TaxID=238106 RepID=UPI003F50339B
MWNKGVALFMPQHLIRLEIQLSPNCIESPLKSVCQGLDTWTTRLYRRVSNYFFLSTTICTKMEPNSPKKIQFAVPLFQSQLDPEASEQIRKRRPTPASLVIINEPSPPEINDNRTSTHEERKQSVYSAPAMKGINEQSKSLIYADDKQQTVIERTELLKKPRRKDTPYHLDLPLFPGVTQMKKQEGSAFLEEEEDDAEDEECDH